jgi:hypothetical protein
MLLRLFDVSFSFLHRSSSAPSISGVTIRFSLSKLRLSLFDEELSRMSLFDGLQMFEKTSSEMIRIRERFCIKESRRCQLLWRQENDQNSLTHLFHSKCSKSRPREHSFRRDRFELDVAVVWRLLVGIVLLGFSQDLLVFRSDTARDELELVLLRDPLVPTREKQKFDLQYDSSISECGEVEEDRRKESLRLTAA